MVRSVVMGGLVGGALLLTGCATKKFVQQEVASSQERVGSQVGRVDRLVAEEKARVDALQKTLDETQGVVQQAARKADEAAVLVGQAASRADEASAKAAAADTTAKEALAKATQTDERLTRLRAARDKRTLTDTQVVLFGFDKWLLDDGAQTTLRTLAQQLQAQPQLTVELEGFTDSTGPSAYNILLSQRRAESVRRFLVEQGVELPRIHSIGFGDIRPVADNKTRQGRDQNRRVAIRIFAPAE